MLLSFAMLSLICALMSGLIGFGADSQADWTMEKVAFFIFLSLAVGSFVRSALSRPSPVWEVIDEIYFRQRRTSGHLETVSMKGNQHD